MHEPSPPALIVLGLTWAGDAHDAKACRLRVRKPDQPSELVPAVGFELAYRADTHSPRHCVGHLSVRRNGGQYVDCLNRPQPGERTCVSCAVADAEFASDLHHAHTRDRDMLDRAVVEHLSQTNVLYLAAFRDGSVKVGTSTERRTAQRLTEQGAWLASVVATTGDGFAVRRLEDLVTAELEVPQSVSIKRKLRGMATPLDDERLAQRLDPLVAQVHELLDEARGAGAVGPIEADVELTDDRWAYPTAGSPRWDGLHLYPARLDQGSHHVEIVDMCGRMAVLVRPDNDERHHEDRFIADLSPLFGIELDVGPYEPDRLTIQDSLF